MASTNDGAFARWVAAAWSVHPELLRKTSWELASCGEGIDGYIVRFDPGTDADLLANLGVDPETFVRPIAPGSVFDPMAEPDDGDNSLPPPATASPAARAYWVEGRRYSAGRLKGAAPGRLVSLVAAWFLERHTNPVAKSSGCQDGAGSCGRCDAAVEMRSEFSDLMDDDLIDEAIAKVTFNGRIEWEPKGIAVGLSLTRWQHDFDSKPFVGMSKVFIAPQTLDFDRFRIQLVRGLLSRALRLALERLDAAAEAYRRHLYEQSLYQPTGFPALPRNKSFDIVAVFELGRNLRSEALEGRVSPPVVLKRATSLRANAGLLVALVGLGRVDAGEAACDGAPTVEENLRLALLATADAVQELAVYTLEEAF